MTRAVRIDRQGMTRMTGKLFTTIVRVSALAVAWTTAANAQDPAAAERGRTVFEHSCAPCHARRPAGRARGPSGPDGGSPEGFRTQWLMVDAAVSTDRAPRRADRGHRRLPRGHFHRRRSGLRRRYLTPATPRAPGSPRVRLLEP